MAVASKSAGSTHKRKNISKSKGQTVALLRNSRSTPLWLLRLCHLQHRFSAIAWLLVATTLGVYSWTVYSQLKWSQAYGRLESLQLYERQLMSTNEAIKNKLALQAQQPDSGLVPPHPTAAIVLQPASGNPERTPNSMPLTSTPTAQSKQLTTIPLSY
jgi:hypothetical protein